MPPVVFDLKAMKAVPPHSAATSKFSKLAYALSADTSPIWNVLAVSLTSGANCGQSAASRSRIRQAVTMFVLTPQAIWHFTQSCFWRVTPYLWSYQRTNRDDAKPLESMA